MSQELYYNRVSTVSEARNYQREFAPLIAQLMTAAPAQVSAGVMKCCKTKRIKSAQLLAPSEMKVIQTDFNSHLRVSQKYISGEVEQLKVAAVATLVKNQDNLLVSDTETVTDNIRRILQATSVQVAQQEIKTAFQEIKAQHTQSFVSHLTQAVKESAAAVGFSEIRVQNPQETMIRVIATNPTGQNLIAEIQTDRQTDIRTELIGYTDGSCHQVMRSFDNEMSARGISTQQKRQKPTHGIPQMPYAQKLHKPNKIANRFYDDEETVLPTNSAECITIK